MKLKITFLFIGLLSFVGYSQGGPPPPCGITVGYACDSDGNGSEVFNLKEVLPFVSFCVPIGEEESDYGEIVYYETENDMHNETNPILNPTAYENKTNPQNIYYRVNAINENAGYEFLKSTDNSIEVLEAPSPNLNNSLTLCDIDSNGMRVFDLSESEEEILAGLDPNLFTISFYETLIDAQSGLNELPKASYSNTVNPQTLYARVSHISFLECFAIVQLRLEVQNVCDDIGVYLYSGSAPRPGFTGVKYLKIKNHGLNSSVSGSVAFEYDPKTILVGVVEIDNGNSITYTSNGFTLNFNDLESGNYERVKISIRVPAGLSLGESLSHTAVYLDSDVNPANDSNTLVETVVGSYDPNDIMESQGPEIFYDDFSSDDYLYYTIRFQNVGTADAINVSIDNTLDSSLDKSTVQMLSASHDYVFTRTDNQLNWQFDDIHLPSESMDEPNSHGYVYYKIKPTAGFQVGDVIPNTAEIYFDFNPAVVTNTFETEFVATLSNEKLENTEFSIYPNPSSNSVELRFNNNLENKVEIDICDIQGKLIFSQKKLLQNNVMKVDVSHLKSGLYFLKVNNGQGETTQKLIVN